MEFADFLGLLEDACISAYDQGVMEVGRPLASLMDILNELRVHCEAHGIPLDAPVTRVAALDELLGMLGIIFFRKVVLESVESAQSKLDQYQQLREQMGWSDPQLATCAGADARAMLLYLNQVAAEGEKRTSVTVRRSSAFWDAFECARRDGLLPASSGPMCHKYFPLFVDEYAAQDPSRGRKPAVEAGEGHGPRKEFFALAGQDLVGKAAAAAGVPGGAPAPAAAPAPAEEGADAPPCSPAPSVSAHPPLLLFNRTAGVYWYNTALPESAELRGAFAFLGWLVGQALLNRAPLGLPLPGVLFQQLLEGPDFRPSLETLAEYDPDAAAGVRAVASLPPEQLRGMLELEGLPADWTADRYIKRAVLQVLRDDIAWQSAAVGAGFFAAVDRRLLRQWQLGPAALAALAAGGGGAAASAVPSDLSALFRISLDDELSGPSAPLVELLWEVLAGWAPELRLRFVEFVTGTSRLPLPGSELLKIQAPFVAMGAAEHRSALGMLPQAHTCDNLLELPNYWESLLLLRGVRGGPAAVARGGGGLTEEQRAELRAEARRVLDERLQMAVLNFQGYGLDERYGGGEEEEDEQGGGGGGGGGGDHVERSLRGAHVSLMPAAPAALTAQSLASLAHLSTASSVLHSQHPLAFSNAGNSPPPAQRGRRSAVSAAYTQPAALNAALRSPSASPSHPSPLAQHPHPHAQPHPQPPPKPQSAVGLGPPQVSDAERQASLLARFEVDLDVRGSGVGALPAGRPVSSTEESEDALR